jgi:hypothetical protein
MHSTVLLHHATPLGTAGVVREDGRVQRRLVFVVAWILATAVTAGVSWLGIRSALTAAVPQHTVPLSGAELREIASPTVQPPAARTPAPATSVGVSELWAAVANGRGGTAYRRTFRTDGGEVAVWCEPGSVRILASTPKAGFRVNVTRTAEDSAQVSFTRDRTAYRVLVRWWNGAPYAELTQSAG